MDSVLAILVQNLKGTVTLMANVEKVSYVDQTIVQLHLDLMCTQIAVLMPVLEMRIFAQLTFLVKLMKVIAIPMMNAKAICFVDLTIVQVPSDFYLQLIAVNLKVINHYVFTFALCMIFMILVSLGNVKKYSHVVAQLPQTVHLSRENETKIVKIIHSAFGPMSM